MIINKVIFTEEEKEYLKSATSSAEVELIQTRAKQRYINSFGEKIKIKYENIIDGDPPVLKLSDNDKKIIRQGIMSDIEEILNALTKEEVEVKIKNRDLSWLMDNIKPNETSTNNDKNFEKELRTPGWSSCRAILLEILSTQVNAYDYYGLEIFEIFEITQYKATEWYEPEIPLDIPLDEIPEDDSQQKKELPHIKQLKNMTRYYFPIDKVTSTIFSGKFPIKQEGRLKAESDKDNNKGKKADIIALVDFDELNGVKISRKLTAYDKLVWNTCVNLYVQEGHKIITVEQIYKAMGNSSNPSAKIQAEILDTVETISRARVSIDTTEEHNLYPKYETVKATFQLLPTVTCTAFARGQIVENAIKILETPNLYTFAENRKQIACLPASILEVPVSKTKDNVTLLDYLIQRISRMKSDKKAPKNILIDTLLVHCGITDKSRKSRLLSKKNGTIKRILDHFAKEKFIQEYNVTDRDIIIII